MLVIVVFNQYDSASILVLCLVDKHLKIAQCREKICLVLEYNSMVPAQATTGSLISKPPIAKSII